MKKGYWKGFVSGLLLTALVLGLGISAGAAGRTIAVDTAPKITVNGTAFDPKDGKGNKIETFSYGGTTYVPIGEFSRAAGMEASYNGNTKTVVVTTPDGYLPSGSITAERAKELALSHAGVKAADAYFYGVKVSWSDGKPVYEVGFYSGDIEYYYIINAQTGAVVSWDYVLMENSYPADFITAARAKELALSHAGVKAANATFTKTELSWNGSQPKYVVEFYTSTTEYDYSINALNGSVIGWNSEKRSSGSQSGNQGDYITAERAKELALADAGVKAADATFTKVKFDWDDGRAEYEIKFYSGSKEYEYDIDARTGAVLDRDVDTYDDWDEDDWYDHGGKHDNGNHYGWNNGRGNPHHDWDDWDD